VGTIVLAQCRMVSKVHLFTEFNLHLVDLTFVPKVYKGVQMGLRGIDESVFPNIAPKLLGEVLRGLRNQPPSIPTVQRPQVWLDLGYFWMTRIHTALDCLDTAELSAIRFACDLIKSKSSFSLIALPVLRN
jgi:hypothetical protein